MYFSSPVLLIGDINEPEYQHNHGIYINPIDYSILHNNNNCLYKSW